MLPVHIIVEVAGHCSYNYTVFSNVGSVGRLPTNQCFFSTRINIFWHIMETSGCRISESNEIYIHPTPSYKRLIRSLVRHVFLPHLTRMHTNLISECTAYTVRVRFSERKFEFSDNDNGNEEEDDDDNEEEEDSNNDGEEEEDLSMKFVGFVGDFFGWICWVHFWICQ